MKLISQDCAVQLSIGTQSMTTGVITWGTAGSIKGRARRVGIRETASMEDVSAMGDLRDRNRAKRGSGVIDIEELVDYVNGWAHFNAGTPIGLPMKLEIKERSGLATFRSWEGLCETWEAELPDGAQIERIGIRCDVDDDT